MERSRIVTVLILYFSFLLDNILLTVVVPIIPDYLFSTEPDLNVTALNDTLSPKSLSYMQLKYERLEKENGPVGVLLSSKALVQLVANPLVGYMTLVLGYNIPLLIGSINLLVASLLFAYGRTYSCLLLARSLHGTASACIAVSGMSLMADLYQGPTRSRLMGLVLGSVAMGVLFGYPLGGILYDFIGKTAPFIMIACLISVCVVLQISFLDMKFRGRWTKLDQQETEVLGTDWYKLLLDPSIAVAACAICISTTAMAVLEPCLPLWLMGNMSPAPQRWQLGTVFIPDSLGYFLGTNFTGFLADAMPRWKLGMASMLLVGLSSVLVPSATAVSQLIVPHLGIGLGIGVLDASFVPLLSILVDLKHGSCYGAVYALQQIAVSLAYFLGPLLGGEAVKLIGFSWLMRLIGIINIAFCPFILILAKSEQVDKEPLLKNTNSVSYNQSPFVKKGAPSYERFNDEE